VLYRVSSIFFLRLGDFHRWFLGRWCLRSSCGAGYPFLGLGFAFGLGAFVVGFGVGFGVVFGLGFDCCGGLWSKVTGVNSKITIRSRIVLLCAASDTGRGRDR